MLRHEDLETCPFPGLSGLPYRDSGDAKDLPGKKKPEAGVFPIPPLEDLLFLLNRNTVAVIFEYDGKTIGARAGLYPDLRYIPAVPERVVNQVLEYFFEHQIRKDLKISEIAPYAYGIGVG